MAPKKAQKMSLNEFLGDSGSWADEMESLPNAPAPRTDEERANDRHGRRDDFLTSRPDRGLPPREDLPLPTQPPYTAFVGNLAFDLTEMELEEFFGSPETKSIKIIKDRDDKPKGFGYIEFTKLEGLKDALAKSGSNFSGRTVRVSVAEPPKDRPSFAGGFDDDSKFENPWRRDGPLPDLSDSRDSTRRRFDGAPAGPGVSEGASDWRSTRPSTIRSAEPEGPSFKRKTSGFATPDGQVGAADKEDVWTIGGKFKPAALDDTGSRFGSLRGRGDMGPPKESPSNNDEGDWRSAARPKSISRNSTSPTGSTPSTPQAGRRKLELFPRSATASAVPTPLSSPKMSAVSGGSSSRSNPFGAAKPVDVSAREKEVAERLDKEREVPKDRLPHPMSRTSSRTASERTLVNRTRTPPPVSNIMSPPVTPPSPKPSGAVSANIRPSVSFANVASTKRAAALERPEDEAKNEITLQTAELTV
jgi:RNA recognition motif-containing protein